MEDTDVKMIMKQLDIIIQLLSMQSFTEERIRGTVTQRKRDPTAYIRGYNLLDGSRTLSQIADSIGVSMGTLSPIIQDWSAKGIIYEVERRGGTFYKNLLRIGE